MCHEVWIPCRKTLWIRCHEVWIPCRKTQWIRCHEVWIPCRKTLWIRCQEVWIPCHRTLWLLVSQGMNTVVAGLDVCFVGVPLDCGASNRSGTRLGPRQIRQESCLIRCANYTLGQKKKHNNRLFGAPHLVRSEGACKDLQIRAFVSSYMYTQAQTDRQTDRQKHTHTHTHTHTRARAHTCTLTYTRILSHTHTHTHSLSLSHTHTRTNACTCTHAHTHPHTHTHTHARVRGQLGLIYSRWALGLEREGKISF